MESKAEKQRDFDKHPSRFLVHTESSWLTLWDKVISFFKLEEINFN